jgi:hypothetical protein
MAQIFIADRMAFLKGSTFEFAWANFGNVMGKFGSNGILQFYFFQHC